MDDERAHGGEVVGQETDGVDGPSPPARKGCGSVVAGTVLVAVGIPMLVCPGPGIAAIATGVAMIGAGLGLRRR